MLAPTTATEKDLQYFRWIRSQQFKQPPQGPVVEFLLRINRALGRPPRFLRALGQAVFATYQNGRPVSARYGVSISAHFLKLFVELFRREILSQEFYAYQLYLPKRWRSRTRQFPAYSKSLAAQFSLTALGSPPDYESLRHKNLFALRCKQAGLPSVPVLAEFVGGHLEGKLDGFMATDLFSKPASSNCGNGAEFIINREVAKRVHWIAFGIYDPASPQPDFLEIKGSSTDWGGHRALVSLPGFDRE